MTASAADMILAARSLAGGRRDVLTLAHRPTSPVVHVYAGPLTPSGRYAARPPVCGTRTRRLTVLERNLSLLDHGRRVCARCTARLSSLVGRAAHLVSRDDFLNAYRGTTLRDLALALAIASSSDDTYRVSFVAQLLFGAPPVRRPVEVSSRRAYYDLTAALLVARRRFVTAERTPEEREAAERDREAEAHSDAVTRASRRRAARLDKLTDRANRGLFLTAGERAEIGMTG